VSSEARPTSVVAVVDIRIPRPVASIRKPGDGGDPWFRV
jgi:hypothetical protein